MRLIDADLVLKRLEEWNTSDKMVKHYITLHETELSNNQQPITLIRLWSSWKRSRE